MGDGPVDRSVAGGAEGAAERAAAAPGELALLFDDVNSVFDGARVPFMRIQFREI